MQVETMVAALPATEQRLREYCDAQSRDETCSQVMKFCATTWPKKQDIAPNILPYWKVSEWLTMHNGLL